MHNEQPQTLAEAMTRHADIVTTISGVRFAWTGRLLVLFTGRAEILTKVYTEREVGWAFTPPIDVELRPRWWRRFVNWRRRGPGGEVCLTEG